MSSLRLRFGSKRPNPVIFVPCGFAAVLAYLLYIDLAVHGGWFLKFAFPRCRCIRIARYGGCNTAEIRSPRTSLHLRRRTYRTRNLHDIFGNDDKYCLFRKNSASAQLVILPLVRCFILGMGLIIIAINKPMQESLKKKFFV